MGPGPGSIWAVVKPFYEVDSLALCDPCVPEDSTEYLYRPTLGKCLIDRFIEFIRG